MKSFYLAIASLLLCGACAKPGPDDAAHAAVSQYVQAKLADPASYEAVRFGKSAPYTRHDASLAEANLLQAGQPALEEAEARALDFYKKAKSLNKASAFFEAEKTYKKAAQAKAQALAAAAELAQNADTARLGKALVHTFRSKNKLGTLVTDSARFLVYKSGQVQAL